MSFQVRDWRDYTQTMASWLVSNPSLVPGMSLPNDLIEGSLERAHLEALAVVMEDYDVRARQAIDYAVNNSVFNAFGFPSLSAINAQGQVTFTLLVANGSDLPIPAGTKVGTNNGVQFVTTADAAITAGAFSVSGVPIKAVVAGVAGNVAAGAVNRVLYPIAAMDAVVNALPTTGGADAETDASRTTRFRSWVNTLVRGTKEALQYAAITVAQPGAIDALAVEPFSMASAPAGVGNVWLYLDDGQGTGTVTTNTDGTLATITPSAGIQVNGSVAAQVSRVLAGYAGENNTYVPGWKAAGVRVELKPVPRIPVYILGTVDVASTGKGRFSEIQAALTNAAITYFNSVTIGQPVTFHGLLVALSISDPDVMAVTLSMALDGALTSALGITTLTHGVPPGVSLVLSPDTAPQVGCRYVIQQDTCFPKWILS